MHAVTVLSLWGENNCSRCLIYDSSWIGPCPWEHTMGRDWSNIHMDLNRIAIIGSVLSTPEISYTWNGDCYVLFEIRTVHTFQKQWREVSEYTDLRIFLWNGLWIWARSNLKLWDKIYLEWRLRIKREKKNIPFGMTTLEIPEIVWEKIIPHKQEAIHNQSDQQGWYVERSAPTQSPSWHTFYDD